MLDNKYSGELHLDYLQGFLSESDGDVLLWGNWAPDEEDELPLRPG